VGGGPRGLTGGRGPLISLLSQLVKRSVRLTHRDSDPSTTASPASKKFVEALGQCWGFLNGFGRCKAEDGCDHELL
jgi:hypothetical protein